MSHTPGPWEAHHHLEEGGVQIYRLDEDGNSSGHSIARVFESGHDGQANARLIAAAPELLEALLPANFPQDGSDLWDGSKNSPMGRIIAAVAKATGRTYEDTWGDYFTPATVLESASAPNPEAEGASR